MVTPFTAYNNSFDCISLFLLVYILIRRTIGTRHSGYTCRAVIIRSEYNELRRQGGHTSGYITRALADAYGLSRSAIDLIIYKKESNKKCTCCGNPVSKYKFTCYGGLCDICLVKQVKIE